MIRFTVDLTEDDNGTWLVTCPDLPEVTTFGETWEGALAAAHHALEEAVAARLADFDWVPEPRAGGRVQVALSLQTSLKVRLLGAMKQRRVTRADLMRRLDWKRASVDRLFAADTAPRLERYEAAFRALGLEVGVSVREVE